MKIDFSSENKVKNDFDYPKLTLEQIERARVVCIEQQPTVGFVHTLKAPQIINGEPVMQSVRQKDGSYKDEMKMDFIGRHLCFGNPNTLAEKGKDPGNCITCAAANENDAVWGAQRTFAMHVIRYKIQPGGFKVQTPFQVELLAWRFSNKVFNSLVDIAEEHGDLRKKDLNLGPCINKMFQNYDINVGSDAVWLQNPEWTEQVKAIYASNKSEDLMPIIGRKVSREMAQEDIDKVLHKWAVVNGSEAPGSPSAGSGGSMDLDTLLTDTPAQETPAPAPAAEESAPAPAAPAQTAGLDDLDTPAPAATPEPPEVASEAPQEKKSDPLDFDALLEGL